jgi:hypothetical protein
VRTDLGTWRDPQADVVVRALKRAGLAPGTEHVAGGTRITVSAAHHDEAHQVLAAAMDDIAQAAASPDREPRRPGRGGPGPGRRTDSERPPLLTQRLRNAAPLVGLMTALLVAAMMPGGALRTAVFVAVLLAFGIVWARRNGGQDDDDRRPPR